MASMFRKVSRNALSRAELETFINPSVILVTPSSRVESLVSLVTVLEEEVVSARSWVWVVSSELVLFVPVVVEFVALLKLPVPVPLSVQSSSVVVAVSPSVEESVLIVSLVVTFLSSVSLEFLSVVVVLVSVVVVSLVLSPVLSVVVISLPPSCLEVSLFFCTFVSLESLLV